MFQVWLTYEEIGSHFGYSPAEARADVIEAGWDRRRSRDGLTRVKLPPATAFEYLRAGTKMPEPDISRSTDRQVALLRLVLDLAERKAVPGASRKAA